MQRLFGREIVLDISLNSSLFFSDQDGHHTFVRQSLLGSVGLPPEAEQRVQQLQQQRQQLGEHHRQRNRHQ